LASGQQLKFKQASAKVRAEGVKPFTKAFGKRMKQLLGGKSKPKVKKNRPKTKVSKTKTTRRTKTKSNTKKSLAGKKGGKKGVAGMTRLKKFLLGLGIGAGVSTVAGLTRVREVEFIGPVVDAGLSGGVEGQLGVALPKIIRLIANRGGFSLGGNGANGLAGEGA